jgi:hypothetical protein
MSNIDEDEILELEISDDETFGLHDGAGSPGKKRRVAEETVPEVVYSAERTVTLLPNSTVPITLPTTSVPEKLTFTQYIQSSFSSAWRVNIYQSQIPLVYPELATSESRLIIFVPSEDGSGKEDDNKQTYYDSGIHSLVEEDLYSRSAKPWPPKCVLGPTPVQFFVNIAWNDSLARVVKEKKLVNWINDDARNTALHFSSIHMLWFKGFGELELILSSFTSTNSAGMKSRL